MAQSVAERQINVPMGSVNNDPNGYNSHRSYNDKLGFSNGLSMTNRDPIDLQFKDITYTVNLGFSKGKAPPHFLDPVFMSVLLLCFDEETCNRFFISCCLFKCILMQKPERLRIH